jgi:hypothetical protein
MFSASQKRSENLAVKPLAHPADRPPVENLMPARPRQDLPAKVALA